MLFKTPRNRGKNVTSASEKQLDFFSELPDNGCDRLRKRVYSGTSSRRVCGPKNDKGKDDDNALIKAVVVQTGFLRPSVKCEIHVHADSILLQRISQQWPSGIVTSGKNFAMVKTPSGELELPLVFGIPTKGSPSSTYFDDQIKTYQRITRVLGEILDMLVNGRKQ